MVDFYKKAKMAFLIATEPARLVSEILHLQKVMPKLLATAPKGDGHPVLVIPGFLATDAYTGTMRGILDKIGYKTYGWENGVNAGLTEEKIQRLYDRVEQISKENGGQKVSIIGWSLGGIEAHVMAHEMPEMIRDIITLGSPFGISNHPDATPKVLVDAIQWLNEKEYTLKAPSMPERMLTPAPGVPTTSIYSKTDGIAGWHACLNPESTLSENIEVEDAGHLNFVVNPRVIGVIADRLAQKEGQWHPFDCQRCKAPENPNFQLDEDNTFLKNVPLDQRKVGTEPSKPTSPNNSGHHHPAAPPK